MACADWGDRKWQQLVRVTKREVVEKCDLWKWDGENLSVNFYPAKLQQEIEAKRKAGRDTVAKRWGKLGSSCVSSGDSSMDRSANHSADTKGEREGKERERERAREELPASLQTDPVIEVWIRWKNHYASEFNYGNDMAPGVVFQQTKDLVALGPELAVVAIENALSNGKLKKPCLPFGVTTAPTPAVRVGQNITGIEPEPTNYGPLKAS